MYHGGRGQVYGNCQGMPYQPISENHDADNEYGDNLQDKIQVVINEHYGKKELRIEQELRTYDMKEEKLDNEIQHLDEMMNDCLKKLEQIELNMEEKKKKKQIIMASRNVALQQMSNLKEQKKTTLKKK